MTTNAWTRGGLRIKRAALDAIEADARAAYGRDEEACGYLRGPAADALLCDEAVGMENLANKLHALDPERYFRTGRTYFEFNTKRFGEAVTAAERGGQPVKVLYHSHLDAGAYFSPTDAAAMSMGEPPEVEGGPIVMGPGPAWPVAFLVTSVREGKVDDHKLFVWDAGSSSFVASSFEVV
jgi:[CysO sulfur-carrier protein]-S-L-cysteine hydrolase